MRPLVSEMAPFDMSWSLTRFTPETACCEPSALLAFGEATPPTRLVWKRT